MPEQQDIEYKRTWRDEYLKWICGFANAQGGKIFIGVDDDGKVIGLPDHKALMEDLPNKIASHLGLVVDVNLRKKSGKNYIEIDVPVSTVPISYHGAYHYRSGSTKQELKGTALQNWLLRKSGTHWEDISFIHATIDDLDEETIRSFVKKALERGRISPDAEDADITTLLKNLSLITSHGHLTNAAILVFGKRPSQLTVTSSFKIGRFGRDSTDLRFQDVIETNLFNMPDKVMEKLKDKYLIRPISYKGLERIENLEYPDQGLREAILNAIIHKDYSSTWIFLRVFDDSLQIWNPGALPDELTIEQLKERHSSYPRNRKIADIFFRAGYVESWGRGINKIIESSIAASLPEPVIEEYQSGFQVTLFKDIYQEASLANYKLNDRQKEALLFWKHEGEITTGKYMDKFEITDRTALRDLSELVDYGLLKKIGERKATRYVYSIKVVG